MTTKWHVDEFSTNGQHKGKGHKGGTQGCLEPNNKEEHDVGVHKQGCGCKSDRAVEGSRGRKRQKERCGGCNVPKGNYINK